MSDYDALWRSLVDADRTASGTRGGSSEPGPHSASAVRIIDATIVVVRAVRNLAGVTEDVLIEQRDRLDRARRTPQADNGKSASSTERIDLSY